MKLQTLTVIFIIILLPITIAVSQYISTEISTINNQTDYDTKLNNATYDAIKTFQLNESNTASSDVDIEKIRDVKASIESFYNSLASSMLKQGYTERDLNGYVPCLLYGLYDGYYIYTAYTNESNEKEYELKPYVYYTEQLTGKNNTDLTISYTLDSYIIVTGMLNGKIITKSGYLVSNEKEINEQENLKENISLEYRDANGNIQTKYYENCSYVYKKFDSNGDETTAGQAIKYYYISDDSLTGWYSYGTDGKLKKETMRSKLSKLGTNYQLDISAKRYKDESMEFTTWVRDNLKDLKLTIKQDEYDDEEYIDGSIQKANYLNISSTNDPDDYSSEFNEHRRKVIKKSIKSNLKRTLFNYRSGVTDFQMPELNETEWDKIINNVCLISFMQGLPLKNKLYRGYSIVTNTQSKDFVDPDEIYLITDKDSGDPNNNKYYKITWKGFSKNEWGNNIIGAYRNIDFENRKSYISYTDNDKTYYYYSHFGTAGYDSIVTSRNSYEETTDPTTGKKTSEIENAMKNINENVKKAYYTALYRERYVNFKSLNYGN